MSTRNIVVKTFAGAVSLEPSMSGRIYVATGTTGDQVFTLPKAYPQGQEFTIISNGGGSQILVTPRSTDNIITKASEGGASVAPAAGTGIKNTTATAIKGDRIKLVSDGGVAWYTTEQSGTWASQ
jgi:hypothetical protein